jgi:hypothetical protein
LDLWLSRLREFHISTKNSQSDFYEVHDPSPHIPLDLTVENYSGSLALRALGISNLKLFSLLNTQSSDMYLLIINEPDSPPGDERSQITSAISPPFDPRNSRVVDLTLPVLLDDGQSQTNSGLRNFGKSSLLHAQSAKACAPCFYQTVVVPLCCDPTVTFTLSPEILISLT